MMMKKLPRLAVSAVLLPTVAWAVYAPVPEQDQGKALTFRLGASVYYDSNIFGAPTGKVDSMVYNVSPEVSFNGSLTDQTFLSLGYLLSIDQMVDRPGDQSLLNHTFTGRVAHEFSKSTNLDLNELYAISENPASLLAGIPLNTDQSFKRNQIDARFTTAVGAKTTLVIKYRNLDFAYDAAGLAAQLDRNEHLTGLEAAIALLPETKLVGEYRYQDVNYDVAAAFKNKTSHFFLAGFDHRPGEQTLLGARVGFESRTRRGAGNSTAPYVELTARREYREGSYVSAGYTLSFEEASDVVQFLDTQTNRFFLNFQHHLSALVTASGSVTYEPSRLQGRGGVRSDIDEDTTRLGLGLTWLPNKNWMVNANYDYDRVASNLANRDQSRNRVGLTARVTF